MKKIQKKKTLRRIAFFSLSVVVVLSNADENDSPRKLFLSLSLSKYRGKERPRNDVLNNNNNNNSKKLSLSSLSSLSLDFSSRLI